MTLQGWYETLAWLVVASLIAGTVYGLLCQKEEPPP